jgi:hypothetical protein
MSDLPYNNNPKDECFYCSHIYTFHSSSDNIQEGRIETKRNLHDDNSKGCSFVNEFDKRSCNCPGFRSSSSLSSSTITKEQWRNNVRN